MKNASLQGVSEGENKKNQNEKGFTQVPNELLDFLTVCRAEISKQQIHVLLFLVRQLTGYHAKFRPLTINDFVQGTHIAKQNLNRAIQDLIEKKVIIQKKVPGVRAKLYGFNDDVVTRSIIGEAMQTVQVESKVIDLMTFKVIKSMTSKSIDSNTFKNRRAALVAATQRSKYIQIKGNKSLNKELEGFIQSRPRATKSRWERFILETLEVHPDDQDILSLAIQRVESTKKDFFGKPILASSIGLFEKSEWANIKTAFLAILQKEKEEEDKKAKRKENEELVRRAKIQNDSGVDIQKISPVFQRYAEMKGNL